VSIAHKALKTRLKADTQYLSKLIMGTSGPNLQLFKYYVISDYLGKKERKSKKS
jgi:hypothetical protein